VLGQRLWLEQLRPWVDSWFTDNYGTAVGVINPDAKYKVVIEAHADEISWFVHYITKDGFIYVRRNGGSDHMIAPSKRVNIHTDPGSGTKGIVKAIFGWPAIHVRNGKNDPVPVLGQHLPGLRLRQQGRGGEASACTWAAWSPSRTSSWC
jgi:putative aminopeptidase FrvX